MKVLLLTLLVILVNVVFCAQDYVYAERCTQKLEIGPCFAAFQKFGFDPVSGSCKQFVYGGCKGNTNRFDSKEECELVCKPMHG